MLRYRPLRMYLYTIFTGRAYANSSSKYGTLVYFYDVYPPITLPANLYLIIVHNIGTG